MLDKVWWTHIIKAHKFEEDIVKAAAKGKSVLLSLPENVPWKNTLLDMVEEQLKQENYKNAFEYVDCPKEEPGLFLLNNYCRREKRSSYRYGISYAEFLGKCQDIVLNDRYIWVHDIPQDRCEEWLDFVTEYNKNVKDKTPAIFILEVHGFYGRSPKGIQKLVFDQAITAYDRFAFCALAASDSNTCREYLRPYLAELVSTVCRDDIELCAACIQKGVRFLKDPKNTLKQIISTEYRSDGERYSYLRLDDLRSLIWETQLKAVFPVIERYRSYFIKRYSSYIQKALPLSNPNGQDITSPEDVEIGMLVYLVGNGNITLADSSEYPELERFRDARNNLAHLNILESEDVELILKRAETL